MNELKTYNISGCWANQATYGAFHFLVINPWYIRNPVHDEGALGKPHGCPGQCVQLYSAGMKWKSHTFNTWGPVTSGSEQVCRHGGTAVLGDMRFLESHYQKGVKRGGPAIGTVWPSAVLIYLAALIHPPVKYAWGLTDGVQYGKPDLWAGWLTLISGEVNNDSSNRQTLVLPIYTFWKLGIRQKEQRKQFFGILQMYENI